MKKKILSLLVTMGLAASLVPVSVFKRSKISTSGIHLNK